MLESRTDRRQRLAEAVRDQHDRAFIPQDTDPNAPPAVGGFARDPAPGAAVIE